MYNEPIDGYGLTEEEWLSMVRLPAPNLLPCCPAIEDLRSSVTILYALGEGVETIEVFLERYELACDLHDMSYSEPLTHLAHHFRFSWMYYNQFGA